MSEGFNFFLEMHELIFEYLDERALTKGYMTFNEDMITLALFIKRKKKELKKLLDKYA